MSDTNQPSITPTRADVLVRLSMMMFLQFFVWGSYLVSMGKYLATQFKDDTSITGQAYGTNSIAAIISPLIVGFVADKLLPGRFAMGILHIVGGVLLYLTSKAAGSADFYWLLLGYSLCYMPTLALANSVTFGQLNAAEKQFPAIRVWGTIGWIAAGWAVVYGLGPIAGSDAEGKPIDPGTTALPFQMGAAVSVALGLYCFTLPADAPTQKKQTTLAGSLGLDALRLLGDPSFLVFALCSMLICIPLSVYYGWTNRYISELGLSATETKMSFGQISEIVFMLLMPVFLARFGVKTMLIIGMTAWFTRYFLFSFASGMSAVENQRALMEAMLIGGILLHGICYDFFFVTGHLYTDHKAPKELRASAQGLIALLTYGVGMFAGNMVGAKLEGTYKLAEAKGKVTLDWGAFWFAPALMAVGFAVVFLVLFRDYVKLGKKSDAA